MALNSEDLYLNRAKLVMIFLGVWVPPENETTLRRIYRYFMFFLQYLFLCFQIINIVDVWGDLEAVSQATCVLFTQASRIKRLLFIFLIGAQLCCTLWALKPLFDDAGSRKFPFDMWMPVTPESSPNYELGYISQLITISISACMYFGADSVALSTIIFGCAQIEIIKDKILSIEPMWDKRGADLAKTRTDNYEKLVECIKHHQAVHSFTRLVEDAFHSCLLFQLIGGVGIICMSVLRMLVINWQSMQFISIASYLFLMNSQLFVCCWCGHELTATSEDLHTVLYKCIWYEQDVRFKRTLVFAMMRMSRPIYLRAGHYFTMSRQTFVAVLRMSYSYTALLYQAAK